LGLLMDSPTPPAAPDQVATAKAQGDMNQNTATTQQLLNMTNQVTPDGSLTYNQSGSNTFTGADGKTYTVPQFTATQTLSPTGQQLHDLGDQSKINLGNAGVTASKKIGDILGTNINLSNDAVENRLMELGTKRLQPQFARDDQALRTQLINSGIRQGSDAWNTEMTRQSQSKNDALDQLLLSGHSTAVNDILTERNQPLNEISALMSGSQVGQPNYTSTPQTQVGGVDYAGMVANNYNAQNDQYKTQMSQNNAMMGGMFGLGGTLGSAAMKYGPGLMMMSDRRLKSDIERIGTTKHGLPFYEYTIFGERQRGVMADEVEKVMPEAVEVHDSGFKMVNYSMLGLA
jgi:hypothetical protein